MASIAVTGASCSDFSFILVRRKLQDVHPSGEEPREGGGGVLAPSLGTHCEIDPKSSGGESRDRGAVTALYP